VEGPGSSSILGIFWYNLKFVNFHVYMVVVNKTHLHLCKGIIIS
jgi:hypothetical protein